MKFINWVRKCNFKVCAIKSRTVTKSYKIEIETILILI